MPDFHRSVIAEAVVADDDDGVLYRASAHHKRGVLIVRELGHGDDPDLGAFVGAEAPDVDPCSPQTEPVLGLWVAFPSEEGHGMFVLTAGQREAFKMSDHVYQELNIGLALDYERRERGR